MASHSFDLTYPLSALPRPYLGNESEYSAERLTSSSNDREVLSLPRVGIKTDDFYRALADIAKSTSVFRDPVTLREFEYSVANLDAPEGIYDAEFSTYNSAISSNPNNALEFAENAALEPGKRRMYIASLGNGFTDYLGPAEQRHFGETGSLLSSEGALEPVKALARALRTLGVTIDRISANSAGGNLATALATELPEGSVSHIYLKNRPNIISHSPLSLAKKMLFDENFAADRKNKRLSEDEWALTEVRNNSTLPILEEISAKCEELDGQFTRLGTRDALSKLWKDAGAYSQGGNTVLTSPARLDSREAMRVQEEAKLTFHFSAQDSLHKGRLREIAVFIRDLHIATFGRTEGLVVPGTHADHTYMPSVRWTFERYAFNR